LSREGGDGRLGIEGVRKMNPGLFFTTNSTKIELKLWGSDGGTRLMNNPVKGREGGAARRRMSNKQKPKNQKPIKRS
jgi:hypothetical protein